MLGGAQTHRQTVTHRDNLAATITNQSVMENSMTTVDPDNLTMPANASNFMTRNTDRSAMSQRWPGDQNKDEQTGFEARAYASSKHDRKKLSHSRSALHIPKDEPNSAENRSEDPDHLSEMRVKLH